MLDPRHGLLRVDARGQGEGAALHPPRAGPHLPHRRLAENGTYTILTTEANTRMAEIHNSKRRMPVIIPEGHERDWLNPHLTQEEVLALCAPRS
ncbi:MAG: SOS response-associated peptidase family protein [Flavobacteriales bacterium]|nr:SOS response-associated peptidase family protein [Flavobacteriales bacterium]